MPINYFSKERFGSYSMYKWEEEMFELKKIKSENTCLKCGNKIAKGCFAYGSSYLQSGRICLNCIQDFVDNFVDSIKELEKMAKKTITDLNAKKGELLKNNLINSV